MPELEAIVGYLDEYLQTSDFPDYPTALNGLQVAGARDVRMICAAVDASERTVLGSLEREADLLLVHHGLFWDGLAPVVGRLYRRLTPLIRSGVALYSAHLPLDAHEEVGNCAVLGRELGIELMGRFGRFKDADIGWWGTFDGTREDLKDRLQDLVGGPVRLIDGGHRRVARVGIVTGAGGSLIAEAAGGGLDALITGEGAHHTYFDATELGVNVYYAGHYATETWGVRALAAHVADRFDVSWEFVDFPTGL